MDGTKVVIALSGEWRARETGVDIDAPRRILETRPRILAFNAETLGHWDSALIAFLSDLQDAAQRAGIAFDDAGLPASARRLLALTTVTLPAPAPKAGPPLLDRLGLWAFSVYDEATEVAALTGNSVLRGGAALMGRSAMRGSDLLDCMRDTGATAK